MIQVEQKKYISMRNGETSKHCLEITINTYFKLITIYIFNSWICKTYHYLKSYKMLRTAKRLLKKQKKLTVDECIQQHKQRVDNYIRFKDEGGY